MTQHLISGARTRERLTEWAAAHTRSRELIWVASPSASAHPWSRQLREALGRDFAVRELPFSTPLLTGDQWRAALERCREVGPEPVIVSLGGGSVMDLGKLLAWGLRERSPSHVAVPTTAGTGSEATCFAAYFESGIKQSLDDPWLEPACAVLEPALLADVPRATRVHSGLDALAQAIESCWSVASTEESERDALKAIGLIGRSLERGVETQDPESLGAMQLGAYFSGRAIRISRTTLAHALSYPLTARYGIAHGLAVFLCLPEVARFNAAVRDEDCNDPRGVAAVSARIGRIGAALGVASDESGALARELESRLERLGVARSLAAYGAGPEARGLLAAVVQGAGGTTSAGERARNNPRRSDLETFGPHLEAILDAR